MQGMRARFDRETMMRHLPFTVVALVGQLSALWPPGPTDVAAYRISTGILVLSAVLIVRRPGRPAGTWLVRASIYIVSVSFLMLATGGINSGLGALFLVPVVGVALYGEAWESATVVGFVLAATLAVSSVSGPQLAGATPRRLVLLAALASMVSVGIHTLRRKLVHSNIHTTMLLELEGAVNAAARELVHLSDPPAIVELGTELAAKIGFPPESKMRRAGYYRIEAGRVFVYGEHNETGESLDVSWLLDEHPYLAEAVASGRPVAARFELDQVGPAVRAVLLETGVTHGALVPVCPDGVLDGVLSISDGRGPIGDEYFERVVALGHFLELALANWSAHEKLQHQATADERRRIARELHDGLAHELAFIASKTRGSRAGLTKSEVDVRELAGAADRALDEARRAITVLSATRQQTLDDAIAQTSEDLAARLGLDLDLALAGGVEVPGEVTENVLRILREAMTNAATHGHAAHVRVELARDDQVRLIIGDDGRGFDPGRERPGAGFGLLSMRERAASIGADLEVESSPTNGTRISVAFR
jgi:signal transduction histidine kinase